MNNPYDPTQPIKVTEGIGHCNSKEKKYAGMWKSEKEVPTHLDKSRLEKREKNGQYGPYVQYKVENEDIYSLVNTIIKMAKKRAMVDAALTVGSLSDIFTQDIVDEDEIQSKDEAITTMTLEDAQKVVAPVGRQKGKSLGEIYKIDRGSFEWLAQNARDEVVKRACHVITVSVEQHKESKTANAAAQQKPATPAPEVKEAAATTFVAPEGDPFIGTPMERK